MSDLQPSGEILLSLLILLPLFGAMALSMVDKRLTDQARNVAIWISFLEFIFSLVLVHKFDATAKGFQFVERKTWIPDLGIQYVIGVDGLSIWLLLLTTFLTTLVLISSRSIHKKVRSYLAFLLMLESGMVGTLVALDGVTFYIFWELMLIPMYFLIGIWGGPRRIYAALKFVLYTALGSLLMLVAIAYLAYEHSVQFGAWSFFLGDWMKLSFPMDTQLWLFSAFALAFAIKVPVFPLHTWLPDAHVEAPTGGSVILAGVLLKMGLYGLLRFALPIFPEATIMACPLFALLGVIGIVYGALMAWVQTDMKKLVAYSSVSHLGFCVLGFAAMNLRGIQGCVLQMLNHGISTAALFFLVGVLYDRKHTRMIEDYQGLAQKVPLFAATFLVFSLSSIGLPLTNGFVGEFLILLSSFEMDKMLAATAVSGVILGAMYMLSLYRRVCFGRFNVELNDDLTDLNITEKTIFATLAVLVFVLGLFPGPVLTVMEPASRQVLEYAQEGRANLAAAQEKARDAEVAVQTSPQNVTKS